MTDQGPAANDTPGLDLAVFAEFFGGVCPGVMSGPLTASVIAGGRSNLTYLVTDGSTSWVVRRPPLGHVLATAHDMGREFKILSALKDTDVPVARPLAMCTDESILGAPFYVMQYVEGTTYRFAPQFETVGPVRTASISRHFTEKLAVLHALDPVSVGLGDLGRPDGYVERQIRRWGKQFESSKSRELAGIYELMALLEANLPPAQAPAIVHGDYRIDNVIINANDEVAAIVDWEMSTLGDPLADLGLLLVYNRLATISSALGDASTAPGYLTEAEGIASYAAVTSRDLSHLPFYIALGSFKLAVILEGIHFRYTQGQTVGKGFDLIGDVVAPVIQSGIAELS